MANLTTFLLEGLAKPTGLWPKLFDWFESFVGNYGWTIVLFTLAVKLLVSPLEFYNRYSTRKNTLIQKRLGDQVQKINIKYQNNREEANRQVSALYKREGYNMVGSCVFMLINMIVTLVIFFTFFDSLRVISSYKMINQYDQLQTVYYQTLENTENTQESEQKTLETFLEINENNKWLWLNNIWRKDAKVNSIPSYTDLVKAAENSKEKDLIEYINTIPEEQYNEVISSISSQNREWNGFFILAILTLLTTFLSQYISEKMNDAKPKNTTSNEMSNPNQATMQVMKLILPLIMLTFVLTNTASFGIYILVGNLFGIITNILFSFIVKKITKKEEAKYLAYIEKQAIQRTKKNIKPRMVNYKNLGDRL